jgi:hypothetical protein
MAVKKKARKKKKSTKSKPSVITDLSVVVSKCSRLDGGKKFAWKVAVKNGKNQIPAGTVVATSAAEANKKAKRLMKSLGR